MYGDFLRQKAGIIYILTPRIPVSGLALYLMFGKHFHWLGMATCHLLFKLSLLTQRGEKVKGDVRGGKPDKPKETAGELQGEGGAGRQGAYVSSVKQS